MQNLLQTNAAVIQQLVDLLLQLNDAQYSYPLTLLHHNSIGKHCRHIIEFYQTLERGMQQQSVDYDARVRDQRLETQLIFTLDELHRLQAWCQQLQTDQTLYLTATYSDATLIPTTLSRELVYLLEHTIHHLAIIGIAVTACFPEVQLPAHFGVAYSTIRFQESRAS